MSEDDDVDCFAVGSDDDGWVEGNGDEWSVEDDGIIIGTFVFGEGRSNSLESKVGREGCCCCN